MRGAQDAGFWHGVYGQSGEPLGELVKGVGVEVAAMEGADLKLGGAGCCGLGGGRGCFGVGGGGAGVDGRFGFGGLRWRVRLGLWLWLGDVWV